MNIRWYLVVYDEAGDALYPMIGLTDEYFASSGMGGFVSNITSGIAPKCASATP